jgi:AcrR family transcriptional regulator
VSKPIKTRGSRDTGERLEEAAKVVFARDGFHGASVSAICRAANVAQGTFYRYFSNKDDAFLLLVEHLESSLMARLQDVTNHEVTPTDRLLGVYRATLAFIGENVALYQVFREAEFIHSEIPQRFYARVCARLRNVIQDGVAQGMFEAPNPEVASYAVLGVILFLALRYILWDEPGDLAKAEAVGADLILHGIDPERRRSLAKDFAFSLTRPWEDLAGGPRPVLNGGQATRHGLLEAAERVFGQVGFYKASVAAITYLAGVGQGTFYLHFPSKVAIFNELVREISHNFRRIERTALDGLDDRRRVECAGYAVFFEWIQRHQTSYRIVREAEFVDHGIGRWYYQRLATAYSLGLRRGMDSAQIRPADSQALAYALLGIGHLSGQRWILWDEPSRVTAGVLPALAEMVLCGLRCEG